MAIPTACTDTHMGIYYFCTVLARLKATLNSYREGAKAKYLGVVCKVKRNDKYT